MSMLAGIFYFDLRPVGSDDTEQFLAAFAGSDPDTVDLHRSPGLLMGQAAGSHSRRPTRSALSAAQNVCTLDGRVDNRRALSAELGDCEAGTSSDATLALQLYEARTSSVQHICTRLGIAKRTFYRDLAAHRTASTDSRRGEHLSS